MMSTETVAESTFQTFDSFEDTGSEESVSEDWSESSEEEVTPEPKAKDEGLKVLDDTDVDGDGKVVKPEGKKEAKKEKEETFEDEEEVEEEKPLEEQPIHEKVEDKLSAKMLRMKMGDDLFNIKPDATLKVKVDGSNVDVPIQELINNYSGKTAWDKKFTEIGKEKKTLEFEKAQLTTQKNTLVERVNSILTPIRDKAKNPMDAMLNLVEMTGEDPYDVYRRTMESNLEELSSLLDMTETERELYFHKKKDELHGKVQRQRQEKITQETTFNQAIQRVDALRQAKNVSEDAFVEASDELEAIYKESGLDVNSITEESVVDYASLKPHIAAVKELVAPFEENISDEKYGDVIAELSRNLRDGALDKKAILEVLKRNFSVEEEVKELNTKVYAKQQGKPAAKKIDEKGSNGFESFDDDWN